MDTYHINTASLAEMFGLNVSTIRRYFAERNLNVKFRVGNSMNAEERAQWENFLRSGTEEEQRESLSETPEEKNLEQTAAEDVVCDCGDETKMKEFSLLFTGKIDPHMIANSLLSIIGTQAVGDIAISCRLD